MVGGMRGRSVPIRRTAAAIWLTLVLAAVLPAAASADPTARGYEPNPNHLSVVVTTDLVYITWTTPAGVQPARVYAMRGPAATCPTSPANGTQIGGTTVTSHVIDSTVTAGDSYCYSIFVTDSAGTVTKVGSTGSVPVPDLKAPPPAPVASPTPPVNHASAPSSSSGLGTVSKALAASVGALLALALLLVIVRMLRRSRPANAGPAFGTELRLTFTGLSASALIIPAVIALGWVLVVTAVVVFR
jgi:hypothetical protein